MADFVSLAKKLEVETEQKNEGAPAQPGPGGASPQPVYLRQAELSKKVKTHLEMQGEICSYGSKVNDNFTAPSNVTGQKVVKFQANIDFTCACMICDMQMAKANQESSAPNQKQWTLYSNPKESATYFKLIDYLISPSTEIDSC